MIGDAENLIVFRVSEVILFVCVLTALCHKQSGFEQFSYVQFIFVTLCVRMSLK